MMKMESNEEKLLSDLHKVLQNEHSIDEDFNTINTQKFQTNKFLICKYDQSVTPNLKHRKFAKTKNHFEKKTY